MTSEPRPPSGTSIASLPVSTGERPALAPSLFADRPDLDARGVGDALERVYTPDRLARFCVGLLDWTRFGGPMAVLEPHAGGGAFLRALVDLPANRAGRMLIQGGDLDPDCWAVRNGAAVFDFLAPGSVSKGWHRVIGNPPFDNAEEHVDRGLEVADEVAFILPMGRLDAAGRCDWYRTRPLRKVWILAERPWEGSRQCGFFWFDRNDNRAPTFECEVVSWA